MKRFLFGIFFMLISVVAYSQNIQLHYDTNRTSYSSNDKYTNSVTLTFENYVAESNGSWYYFIDLETDKNGVRNGYVELHKEFDVYKHLSAHVEYDGGLSMYGQYNHTALIGPAFNYLLKNNDNVGVQFLYRQNFGNNYVDASSGVQFTLTWTNKLFNDKVTFTGFTDVWKNFDHNENVVVLLEPQIWYNCNKNIAFGTEIETHYNVCGIKDKLFCNPSIAVKYTFK